MRILFAALLVSIFSPQMNAPSRASSEVPWQPGPIDVMPLPANVQLGSGELVIDGSFAVKTTGAKDGRVDRAVERFVANLSRETGIPFTGAGNRKATLTVHVDHAMKSVPEFGEDESYTLDITSSDATLAAPDTLGALHGFETFLQLVQATPDGFRVPAVHIEDKPRFAWRGLMIDVCRHFIPLDVIRRNIDGMAAVKLNVLHLHLSDDQGFRVESKKFPRLQEVGSDGLYFTQAELRDLIGYAADRGIRIVPEFDMPGHSTAWILAYPELSSGPPPPSIERTWGVFDPTMDPAREETYKYLDKFIGEMAGLFPDHYFHIGGDEVNGKQWDGNAKIQGFMREHQLKDNHELQQYFTERVQKIVANHHKIMVGWDEILSPGMSKDIVIQSWRGPSSLAVAAKQGYSGLLSAGYYLDAMWPAARHYAIDPMSGDAASLNADEKSRILGGEACAWAEFLTPQNFDSRIWPRTAPIAERLWSPEQSEDVADMYRRMAAVSWRLEFLGLTHKSNLIASLGRTDNSDDIGALRVLTDTVVPVGLGIREHDAEMGGMTYTSATPLNRLTDVVPPENDSANDFTNLVNRVAASGFKDAREEAELRDRLTRWRDNDAVLQPELATSTLLKELAPVSQALSSLGAAGLQALDYIAKGQKAPDAWKAQTLAMIEQAKKPMAGLLIAVAPGVETLVEASAGVTPTPAATTQ